MEFIGAAQQIIQALTPQPTGRPRSASQALRRSVVVGAIGIRNMTRPLHDAYWATIVGTMGLSLLLAKSLLENNHLTADHIGRMRFISLQVVYTLAFMLLSSPLWRKARALF